MSYFNIAFYSIAASLSELFSSKYRVLNTDDYVTVEQYDDLVEELYLVARRNQKRCHDASISLVTYQCENHSLKKEIEFFDLLKFLLVISLVANVVTAVFLLS